MAPKEKGLGKKSHLPGWSSGRFEAVLGHPHVLGIVSAMNHDGSVRLGRISARRVRQVPGVLVLHGDVVLKLSKKKKVLDDGTWEGKMIRITMLSQSSG